MIMRLVQYRDADGARKVGLVTEDGNHLRPIRRRLHGL